jgi:hypothetical protein
MAFPVTLNGVTYTLANFEGLNYVEGFPDALEDFVTEAGTQVSAAATSATNAATSETNAASSATAAASSATAAAASATAAQASLDAIEGLYLGAQSSDPTVDLNGDALTAGDWYFNTPAGAVKIYDGSAWVTITSLTFELVDDTTPQLGGNLDLNGNNVGGVTPTELGYVSGVTSSIQTQLDSKVGANYTGDVDITGELLVDSYNETFKQVSSASSYTGYQLGSASYIQNFSVSSQDNIPLDVAFNSDGTKMFVVGSTNDSVYEYDLSTAFDISTASYSQSFSVTSQDTAPYGLDFNTDGTKMFILGGTNDAVFEYDLSTGFDISTASYSQNFSLTSQSSTMIGQGFSPDGTRMYTIDVTSDAVWQYNLSTGFDVSTASYIRNFSVGAQDTSPHDVTFNDDGTKMYVVGNTGDDIIEYALTTGFEINTASYVQNLSVFAQDASPVAVKFNNDGTKMFVVGEASDQILEYYTRVPSYSTTFDCEAANVFETVLDNNTTVVFSNPPAAGTATDSTAYAMSLKVVQDSGASGYTVTWPTSVDWPSATAPTLTATASAVDQFVFYTYDGGTTWYGFTAGQALG